MTGHITQVGKGRWRIVVEVGRDPATGRRRRIVRRHRGRKAEAEEILTQLLSELRQGSYVEPSRVTVAEWLHTWLCDYKKLEIRPTTWESYESLARVHLVPAVGAIYLQDLRPEHLQKLYNDKLEEGKSARTVRYIHHVINSALNQAVKNRLIQHNVAEATTLPKQKPKEVKAMTTQEQERFLAILSKDRLGPAFLTLLGTGIRRGELLALRWSDINLEAGTLRIRRNLVRTNEGLIFQEPKTEKSRRTIPLPTVVWEALAGHQAKMNEEGHYGKDKLVFCTTNGTPFIPQNFNRKFIRLRRQAGLEHINLHALRHTFATRLLEVGENLKVVQELLGHARIAITADTYSHVSPELKREAVEKLDEVLRLGTNRAPKSDI